MIKLWARVMKDHKMVKQITMFDNDEKMDYSKFYDYISQICHNLDIATPLIVKTHIFNYAKFNFVKFVASDFVEAIDFDCLWIENANR